VVMLPFNLLVGHRGFPLLGVFGAHLPLTP
jgi:hypothetical protein